jgi:multiple sugar transport system permease protein
MTGLSNFKQAWDRQKWAYFFIAPQVLLFAVFLIYPVIEGFRLSLYDIKFLDREWVGLQNYIDLLGDKVFIKATINTLTFVFWGTALTIIAGLFVSVSIFDKASRYVTFVRGSFYLPTIISMVVLSIVWSWLLNPAMGLINYYMEASGIDRINFMGHTSYAMPVMIFMVWMVNIGQAVILFVASMLGISEDILEAAQIDGASRFQKIRHIIVPMTKSTTVYLTILSIISIIKVFIVIDLMTRGGPNYGTTTMMYLCYQEAFKNNSLGSASAIGAVMFLIVFVLSVTQLKVFKMED